VKKLVCNKKYSLISKIDEETLKQGIEVWFVNFEATTISEQCYRLVPKSGHTMLQYSFFPEIFVELKGDNDQYDLFIKCNLMKKIKKGLIGMGVFTVVLGIVAFIEMWKRGVFQIYLLLIFPCFYLIQIMFVAIIYWILCCVCIRKIEKMCQKYVLNKL